MEEVLPDRQQNSETGASPRTIEPANYYKKLGHIKADCRALKAKTDKAQRADQKSNQHEEVNYVGSSAGILTTDPNILSIENLIKSEVLLAS